MLCKPTLRVRSNAINVSVDDAHVYTFEPSGRLHAAFIRGRHYRRALNHRILETWRMQPRGYGGLRERWLDCNETKKLVGQIHNDIAHSTFELTGREHQQALNCIGAWTPLAYEKDMRKFGDVYRPISILPPDQYLSVVVQATEGCSWNKCTFCDFYAGQTFRIRPKEELCEHIRGVREFFGDGIRLRRSVFLGDGNALSAPWPAVVDMFRAVQAGFPESEAGPSWQNTYAFVDTWGGRRLTVAQIKELRDLGLRRVYLGLETGHDALLATVNKPGSAALAVDVIDRFKQAGVSVGIIVMLGIGGQAFAQDHVWDTVKVLNDMPLGAGDLIYFSPLVVSSHLSYAKDMWAANIKPLTNEDMVAQYEHMVAGIGSGNPDGPKIATYNIKRFVY